MHVWVWRGVDVRRKGSPFCTWHRYILQLFHLFEDPAPFLSKTPAIATPPHASSHSFVFFIPASISSPSSAFFLCHFVAPSPHVMALSGCLPPRSLFQEVPTALRVHRVPDRNEDGFYCTMTNSKHFSAEIRMKNQEV